MTLFFQRLACCFLFCFGFVQKGNLSEHYHSNITSTEFKHTSTLGLCGCLFHGEFTEQGQTEHSAESPRAFETMMKLTVTRQMLSSGPLFR